MLMFKFLQEKCVNISNVMVNINDEMDLIFHTKLNMMCDVFVQISRKV